MIMIELKINGQEDRDNVVLALVKNEYMVKVVERPKEHSLLINDYYVQILNENILDKY